MASLYKAVSDVIATAADGLRLTLKHLGNASAGKPNQAITSADYFNGADGITTLSYPEERLPVSALGRYQLDCEIDDCIVCDKCARICPVDCIDIVPIRAAEEFGKTSDGTAKRIYAAKFDIDMAKCCYCGLCTTVCPTECLTMTNVYDYSVMDLRQMTFPFATLTPAEAAQHEQEWQAAQAAKAAKIVEHAPPTQQPPDELAPGIKKPFRPVMKKKPE